MCCLEVYVDVCYCDMFMVNGMLSLMSVMILPPAFCMLSVRTLVKLYTLGVLALGVSLVP